MRHLTVQQVSASLDGALSGVSLELVVRHLAGCHECRERHARLTKQDDALRRLLACEFPEVYFEDMLARLAVVIDAESRGQVPPEHAHPPELPPLGPEAPPSREMRRPSQVMRVEALPTEEEQKRRAAEELKAAESAAMNALEELMRERLARTAAPEPEPVSAAAPEEPVFAMPPDAAPEESVLAMPPDAAPEPEMAGPAEVEPASSEPTAVEPAVAGTSAEPLAIESLGESIAAEPLAAQPATVEPVAVEPVAPEPAAVEPVEPEPVATEPVPAEPAEPEPVMAEPVAVEPIAAEPVEPERVEPEPVTVEPIAAEPVVAEPVEPEPVVPEPVAPELVEPEPVVPEPVEAEPIAAEPTVAAAPPATDERPSTFLPAELRLHERELEGDAGRPGREPSEPQPITPARMLSLPPELLSALRDAGEALDASRRAEPQPPAPEPEPVAHREPEPERAPEPEPFVHRELEPEPEPEPVPVAHREPEPAPAPAPEPVVHREPEPEPEPAPVPVAHHEPEPSPAPRPAPKREPRTAHDAHTDYEGRLHRTPPRHDRYRPPRRRRGRAVALAVAGVAAVLVALVGSGYLPAVIRVPVPELPKPRLPRIEVVRVPIGGANRDPAPRPGPNATPAEQPIASTRSDAPVVVTPPVEPAASEPARTGAASPPPAATPSPVATTPGPAATSRPATTTPEPAAATAPSRPVSPPAQASARPATRPAAPAKPRPAPVVRADEPAPDDGANWPLLCGMVVDETGAPVAGARVSLADLDLAARTDRRGRFCIAAPPGDRTLSVIANGFAGSRRVVSLGAAGLEVSVALVPASPAP